MSALLLKKIEMDFLYWMHHETLSILGLFICRVKFNKRGGLIAMVTIHLCSEALCAPPVSSIFFHPANNSFPHSEWLNSSLSQSVTSCTPMKRKVSLNLPQQCCFTILTFFSPDSSPETSTYSMLSFLLCSHVCMTSNATALSQTSQAFSSL